MQVKDWFFTEAFVNFYGIACLELRRPIQFLAMPAPACPPCPRECAYSNADQEVAVSMDPRWTSRQAQQYATRAIFHHLITREGFPAVRIRKNFLGQDPARKLCYRLNWRVLGLVVNQKIDRFSAAEQQDLLLTELFVNTIKYINVCHEHAHDCIELSLPALDIFYQYFSLRPRQQRQLAGTVKHKWPQVYRLLMQMIRLSEHYSVMQPAECKDMLEAIIALLGVEEVVEVYYRSDAGQAGQHEREIVTYEQLCRLAP
ncbi:MAG TPA: hypothetical protein VMW83_03685 [Spirochaetia bacterium]|nr:hypothetical protein [Spirochaetia bacterium]